MNTEKHNPISRIGYVIGLGYIFLFGIRYIWFYPDYSVAFGFIFDGIIIILLSYLYSKLWSAVNTISYIEEQLQSRWEKSKKL